MKNLRLSEEDLQVIQKRLAAHATVRVHRIKDDGLVPSAAAKLSPQKRKPVHMELPPKFVHKPPIRSKLEEMLALQMRAEKLPEFVRELKPLPCRRYRLDFAWPRNRKGIEVQGMVHRIKGRFRSDIEKRALLMLDGWRVLEVDGESIKNGTAIQWIRQFLK